MSQFLLFVLVGLVCALLDVGLMQLLTFLDFNYILAASVGFMAGLAANFLLHTRLTFRARYSHVILVRFMCVVLVNYLLTILFVSIFHKWIDMAVLGKILSLPLVAINGFFLSRRWVYQ